MNKLIKVVDVAELPETLREGIAPGHKVEVTVRDLGVGRRTAAEAFAELSEFAEKHGDPAGTLDDAVRRIRELRDEWS